MGREWHDAHFGWTPPAIGDREPVLERTSTTPPSVVDVLSVVEGVQSVASAVVTFSAATFITWMLTVILSPRSTVAVVCGVTGGRPLTSSHLHVGGASVELTRYGVVLLIWYN